MPTSNCFQFPRTGTELVWELLSAGFARLRGFLCRKGREGNRRQGGDGENSWGMRCLQGCPMGMEDSLAIVYWAESSDEA